MSFATPGYALQSNFSESQPEAWPVSELASVVDRAVVQVDRALRTLTGTHRAARENPSAAAAEVHLEPGAAAHAGALMRVNHTGEVCAQALYEGQALTARSPEVRERLLRAAAEETDHLVWCAERIEQLNTHTSVLNPIFYGASFALGALAGLAGDKLSLGFVEATEDQVVEHLESHLEQLPEDDRKSRALVAAMRADEARHGEAALAAGGREFPPLAKRAMRLISAAMTATTYRV